MTAATDNNVVQNLGLASYEMSTSINSAQRAFNDLLKTCLGHHGLTTSEWMVIGHLYQSDSARPTQIANILGTTPPYIARLLADLEKVELLKAQVLPDDGRGKSIRLTQKGKELVEEVEIKLEVCLNTQLSEIAQNDIRTYFATTKYIAQHLKH